MKCFGIEFAPLFIPWERRLQTLSSAALTTFFVYGPIFCLFLTCYLLLYTSLWWVMSLYLCWMIRDLKTPERGGRRSRWVNSWSFWKHLKNYYPASMQKVEELELDPKKNYLFTHFPHGYVGSGSLAAYSSRHCHFRKLFPHHCRHHCTINFMFRIPFYRDFMLAIRGISCSAESLNHVLGHPGGGNVAVLLPGGAEETHYCVPGRYDLVLKRRKGFIKLAMRNGVSIIPSIGFGETDLFTVLDTTNVPVFSSITAWAKKTMGFVPLFANGRGFFQYNFGIIPRRKPVTVLLGPEFKIDFNLNPTENEVNEAHARFLEHLSTFFEKNKHKYLQNADDIHIEYK